jgi:hypothetical protein
MKGQEYIDKTLAFAPDHGPAWFYKKLLFTIEASVESDPQRNKATEAATVKAQEQYFAFARGSKVSALAGDPTERYASGLPPLNVWLAEPLPPPPPRSAKRPV